ncbi:hypothetical protein C0995_001157, partial [Termitomyces sp. Mi166
LQKRSIKFSLRFEMPEEAEHSAESQQRDSFEINLDHLGDGSLRFTFPPDETEGKSKVYILTSPNFEKNNPVYNIITIAEEMVNTAIHYVERLKKMAESEMDYLTVMCESLTSQKEKIDSLKKAEGSPIALEVSAQLYLNDAFRFLQSVQMITNDDQHDILEEDDSEAYSSQDE